MTPEDVAAIRAGMDQAWIENSSPKVYASDVLALCDALEDAWADCDRQNETIETAWEQRDEWKASHTHWRTEYKAMCKYAERVEARLQATELNRMDIATALNNANAALARIRARLCGSPYGCSCAHDCRDFRAAIDGKING